MRKLGNFLARMQGRFSIFQPECEEVWDTFYPESEGEGALFNQNARKWGNFLARMLGREVTFYLDCEE